MIKVSILGATGYTGTELMRLLVMRDDVEFLYLTSRTYANQKVANVFPFLTGFIDKVFTQFELDLVFEESDIVFICLPHGHAMDIVQKAQNYDTKIIDLGADFRIKNAGLYEKYYQVEQTASEILPQAVYGLPEKYRKEIKKSQLIANPGCFVTSTLLGLNPAVKNKAVDLNSIIVDSKSGVSGAGRKAKTGNLLSELGGNFKVYNVLKHRHIPEMEQELSNTAQKAVQIQFTPHLLPVERGILSTIYADLSSGQTEESIRNLYEEVYEGEPFVHLLAEGELPQIKSVKGTNFAQIQVQVDERTNRLVILSAIDNLGKGAAGQAIQNMNLLFDLPETKGLMHVGLVP